MFANKFAKIGNRTWQVGIGLFLIIAWEGFARISSKFAFLASSPLNISIAWWRFLCDGILLPALGISLLEAVGGLIIGTVLGCSIGLGLWFSKKIADIAYPYVIALSSIPLFVFAPVLILSLGTGLSLKLFVASVGTTFIALAQAYRGAQNASSEKILEESKGIGATKAYIFRLIIIPGSIDWVLHSIRLNVGSALMGAFIGEFIVSENGLGHLVLRESSLYNVAGAFAAGFTIVILALIMNALASLIEHRRPQIIQFTSVPKVLRHTAK